jgi:hypothetical protein
VTSTRGTAPKPLPLGLLTGLKEMGYIEMDPVEGVRFFRCPKQPLLYVYVVASNMPGESNMVIARWYGREIAKRIDVGDMLELLQRQYDAVSGSTAGFRGVK